MNTEKKFISRRDFLKVSAMALVAAALEACGAPATPTKPPTKPVAAPTDTPKPAEPTKPAAVPTDTPKPAAPTATPVPPTATPVPKPKYNEAPALAELVKAGKLPAVQDRLPLVPKVANEMPANLFKPEIGKYGGTIRFLTPSPEWDTDVFVSCNEPLINTPGILAEEITGNICDTFQISTDRKEFTFHLRQGIRWSDGTYVTTEDVRFAYEDVLMNKELTPNIPTWLKAGSKAGGTPVKVQVVDNYTFKLIFDQPYGGFLPVLAIQGWRGYVELLKPAHYLKKFHKKYATEADLNAAIKEANVQTWVQLFNLKDVTNWEMTYRPALGFPSLYPWVLKETSQQMQVYERNPYYFKVDAAGNQLPYIDKLTSTYVADVEVLQVKILAGETDFTRAQPKFPKLPLYKENEAKGGYKTGMYQHHATVVDIFLNLTYKDPVWREVVRNVKFRQALNMAIDRKEIIDAVFYGNAQPSTIVPSKYDVAGANKLLDEIGLNKKDADGHRLGPDGKVFVIPFETGAQRTDQVPTLELMVQFWEKIGLKTTMKKIDGSLWSQRLAANEMQATTYWSHTPLWYMGDLGQGTWGPLWNQWWNTAGKEGEEPPQDVKDFYNKVASITELAPADGIKAYGEVRKMLGENLYYMVPVEKMLNPVIYSTKLGNVPTSPDAIAIAVNFSVEQFFYKS